MGSDDQIVKNEHQTLGNSTSGDALNIRRDVSFESLSKIVKRSFQTARVDDSATADKGLRMKRPTGLASTLESHQSLNYCKIRSNPSFGRAR